MAVRCRPMSEGERQEGQEGQGAVVSVDNSRCEVVLSNPKKGETKQFTFDHAFPAEVAQKDVYEQCCYGLVSNVTEGYNCTIFAYGQTGTGKTFTMEGDRGSEEFKGIIPRALEQVFNTIEGTAATQFLVTVSMIELYNEDIYDLLDGSRGKLELRERPGEGFYVKDLSTHDTRSAKECLGLLDLGSRSRKKGETQMNKDSSRSHSIFTIVVETSEGTEDGRQAIKRGKLNLVDLAGSERATKTKVTGQMLEESKKINLSLTCLGKVISSLVQGQAHVPYRDSKLTRLLNDSLGGNSKTLMVANVGPASKNYDETLSTLRYANQAKSIKNKPRVNEDPKDAKLKEVQDEISKLKEYLSSIMGGASPALNRMFEGELTETVKSQMMRQMLVDKNKLEEQHREEMDRIVRMRQITDEERRRLLSEVQRHREAENIEREENAKVLEKIASVKNKVLRGQQTKEKYLAVQRELQLKREKNERIRKEQISLQVAAEDAEIEKCGLEKKYASQVEELREKEELLKKVEIRYSQLKGEYDEFNESFLSQIKLLREENGELEAQSEANRALIESYFGSETTARLAEWLVPSPFADTFRPSDAAPSDLQTWLSEFAGMKEVQEKAHVDAEVDEEQERLFLYGTLDAC